MWKTREQSRNVYENKGSVLKTDGPEDHAIAESPDV